MVLCLSRMCEDLSFIHSTHARARTHKHNLNFYSQQSLHVDHSIRTSCLMKLRSYNRHMVQPGPKIPLFKLPSFVNIY